MNQVVGVHHSVAKNQKSRSFYSLFFAKLRKQKLSFAAGICILGLILVAVIGPLLIPYKITDVDYEASLQGPTLKHWLGTDPYGRDIFSRIIAGTRISLSVGFFSVLIGAVIGSFLGLIAGFYGKWIDSIIMRISDVLFAFPGMILAIGIVAILGPGINNVVIAVSVFSVPHFARIVRSSTLSARTALYVEAAQSIGAKNRRLIFYHIFPETLSTIIVYFTMRIGTAILTAASLSFLGLGAQPPSPEWGAMLSSGRDYLETAPHITIFPGLAIFFTVLVFNLFGDGLRDVLDPKIKD
ncbi:nickel transporter permease [Sporolactobacillus terrae]|uniref:Glutathione transport system permease protein GsiD n=1 Tax=Sporolactobacillus terrae TaxID=269673 RepID=A0ABX5QBF7_9BACL|nr:nickel transporter permease [Sporolactobacillus terrae]QAA23954.1 glutathione ABC transporter permease [Sporolactobacillus terrae]QAA26923.1 glutathione ABC transporter permease [Sporolactobacillus terrae]UAK17826.1 ABC transporter permease subunit [Sporolactobacillus terrae]